MSLLQLLLLGLIAVIVGAIYFVFASFAWGAGYQPAPRRVVERMIELGRIGPDDLVYDLGAGTGAIVFRAARERGARVVGVEIEPIRVAMLRLRRRLGGAASRIEIRWGNVFEVPLAPATVVTAFLWPEAMAKLRPRLEAELRPGTRVVSHWHRVPGWTPTASDDRLRVYLYEAPGGASEPTAPGAR